MNMKYQNQNVVIPQESREQLNNTIISLIESKDMQGITNEDIFNSFTGIGGLHGLKLRDYKSYYDYSLAKKEFEQGQFFTPHNICENIIGLINPNNSDIIADINCGMGNFFNYFNEENCYGCEIDYNAVTVASHLYPNATIEHKDFRYYKPDVGIDYVVGNPPFNLKIECPKTNDITSSQFFFFKKSFEILNPAGLVIAVVPKSFLNDGFSNKTEIENISEMFDFIGQVPLLDDTFKQMTVDNFSTKIVCWQKKSENMSSTDYDPKSFIDFETLKDLISERIKLKSKLKLELRRELLQSTDDDFVYKLNKYLFEIKTHPHLQKYYDRSIKHIEKFNTQKCPEGEDYEHWFKHKRITKNKLISYLRKPIKEQNKKGVDVMKFVKCNYEIKIKGYSNKSIREVNSLSVNRWDINHLVSGIVDIPLNMPKNFKKLIIKKQNAFKKQTTPFNLMVEDKKVSDYVDNFYFLNKGLEKCYFNDIQKGDLKRALQKDFSIIAWQQGGGKTGAIYSWSKMNNKPKFIIAPSLAINLTWKPFLEINNENVILLKKVSDIDKIKDGDYVLLSFHFITKLKRELKRWMKINNNNINLCFDESDEITNSKSNKTKSILNIFRRSKRKFLGTGTTTRNNISELYSQLELLYNNSSNFMCNVGKYFVESTKKHNKGELESIDNPYYNKPFPPKYGQTVFTRCFNPSKSTVFGIQKQNQNIYNESYLKEIIEYTIQTKTFKEIAGDKYTVSNISISQNNDERDVYRMIIKELSKVLPQFYNSTGNSRKDAMLRVLRQLNLLIQTTSTPQLFPFYSGDGVSTKAKRIKRLISEHETEKVAIGCTSKKGLYWYKKYLTEQFPNRQVFVVSGDNQHEQKKSILAEFEATKNGLLVSTQQGLKSSVNVPTCNVVIVESLQWNIPKIEQWYFRFIRFDSKENTNVYFINYSGTIESNLLALLMAKEKLNDYIKTLDVKSDDEIYNKFDIDVDILDSLITKEEDEDGKIQISWGNQTIE